MMARILVVDDSMIDLRIAAGILEREAECEIVSAKDGNEALECMETELPDLVVTDLQMPGLNGLELVERLRREYPLIPVVLMTGAGSEQVAVEAIEKGASSYVPKKELANDLVDTVTRLLATATEQRARRRLLKHLSEQKYILPNDKELLSSLCADVRQMLQDLQMLDESNCLRFVSAIDEALLNAYYHGNLEVSSELRDEDASAYYDLAKNRRRKPPYCDRRIYVALHIRSDAVTVVIRDDGKGFDLEAIPDPTDPGFVERAHGRGLLLMRAFVDEIGFNDACNEVTLLKRTKSRMEARD